MDAMKKLLLIALTLSGAAHAGEAEDRLRAFTADLASLEAKFTQQVFDPNRRLTETSQGSLALSAPRQFRWKYDDPFPQLIVADGDNVWIYDEDLEQVTVKNQSTEEAQSPLTVLIDPAQLDREYTFVEAGSRDNLVWLTLTPKAEEAPFVKAEIGFDPKAEAAGSLKRMALTDSLGQRNEVTFRQLARNPKLDPALFAFTPPAGVDVIGEPVSHATVAPIRE